MKSCDRARAWRVAGLVPPQDIGDVGPPFSQGGSPPPLLLILNYEALGPHEFPWSLPIPYSPIDIRLGVPQGLESLTKIGCVGFDFHFFWFEVVSEDVAPKEFFKNTRSLFPRKFSVSGRREEQFSKALGINSLQEQMKWTATGLVKKRVLVEFDSQMVKSGSKAPECSRKVVWKSASNLFINK